MQPAVFLLFGIVIPFAASASTGHLVTINGELVRVIGQNCFDKNHPCPSGQCCVKAGLMYIPEYTGPRPLYEISCKPLRQSGEFCYKQSTTEMCPCDKGLTCTGAHSFGHCH